MNNCLNDQNDAQITLEFTRKYTINDLSEKYSKQISQNQLKFGTLMGEAKKAIQYAIQDGDNELIQFIREFNKKKETQRIEAESIKQQESLARQRMVMNDNRIIQGTNGILLDSKLVLDPTKHQPKGKPQAKQLKSSIEKSSNSKNKNENEHDRGRKCGLCGKNGHY